MEQRFPTDSELFDYVKRKLRVAIVCDALDRAGYPHQAMDRRIRPLLPDVANCGFVGRARTLRWMETNYVVEEDPYGLEIEAESVPRQELLAGKRLREVYNKYGVL